MQLIDLKFDGSNGDAEVDLDYGTVVLKITEKNPAFPTGAQTNIPLNAIFAAISAKINNSFVTFALNGVLMLLDAIP